MHRQQLNTLGNTSLLNLHKVAFLCSRKYPAAVVLKSFDWAIEQRYGKKLPLMNNFIQVLGLDGLLAEALQEF